VYNPLQDIEQDVDVFFYGQRNIGKEEQFDYMMAEASRVMSDKVFIVGGTGHNYDTGNAIPIGRLSLGEWRYWAARSRINLNITKNTDSCVYASSSARPFELAAMGCCIVSDPYEGLKEEWFNEGIRIVDSVETAVDTYEMLLKHDKYREACAGKVHTQLVRKHTWVHRAKQLTGIIRSL